MWQGGGGPGDKANRNEVPDGGLLPSTKWEIMKFVTRPRSLRGRENTGPQDVMRNWTGAGKMVKGGNILTHRHETVYFRLKCFVKVQRAPWLVTTPWSNFSVSFYRRRGLQPSAEGRRALARLRIRTQNQATALEWQITGNKWGRRDTKPPRQVSRVNQWLLMTVTVTTQAEASWHS